MGKKYNKGYLYQKTKKGIQRTKSIGVRSINDIINDNSLTFNAKVNYIRHHYTYYDGYMDMFHDENGNSNENKKILNEIIKGIVDKRFETALLSDINQTMIEWRKSHPKKEEDIVNSEEIQFLSQLKDRKQVILNKCLSKKECIEQFKIQYPYLYSILNNDAVDCIAVNHFKNNFKVPSQSVWVEALTYYCSIYGSNSVFNHSARTISKKTFMKILKTYKQKNNMIKQNQDKFIQNYNKLYENK